jgi:hypothetical protein
MLTRGVWMQLAVCLALLGANLAEGATIFSDDFSTSTLNSATPAAPTATSTNYEVLSTKNATASSIASGSLQLNMGNTSSGFAELEALFKSSPVALTQTGDYVQLTVHFVPTSVNLNGSTSTLNIGLYNSHGAGPVPGATMNNAQLDDDPGSNPTGNAAGWEGYVGRIGATTAASSQTYTRPIQVGETSNEAQDGLFNNAGGGAYDNPSGVSVQTGGTGADLVNGTAYTLWLKATYDAGTGFVTTAYELSDANGVLDSLSGPTDGTTTVATSFDALALGVRGTGSTGPYILDIRSIDVDSNVSMVPEPAALISLAMAAVAFGLSRKRRKST